jgi:hypothetical protein
MTLAQTLRVENQLAVTNGEALTSAVASDRSSRPSRSRTDPTSPPQH